MPVFFQFPVLLGLMKEVFSGNAAPIHTGPADTVLLYKEDSFPQLSSPDGRHIATRTAADNDDIPVFIHACLLPIRLRKDVKYYSLSLLLRKALTTCLVLGTIL
jgi:hypothetical protein